jgi:hypothetical protein
MLKFLQGKASERKLRLFAVACCRRLWHLLTEEHLRDAVVMAERFAEGQADAQELGAAAVAALASATHSWASGNPGAGDAAWAVAAAASCQGDLFENVVRVAKTASLAVPRIKGSLYQLAARDILRAAEQSAQAQLLRDLCAPFDCPALDPSWLAWHDGTVGKLTQGIYLEDAFEQLPILADALEEAGCADRQILDHLRGPGPHTRGCWPLDLLLGKA